MREDVPMPVERPVADQAQGPSTSASTSGREGEEWKTLSRVQNFPLVNSALRAYEQSKASSRVVKVRSA